MKTSTSTLAHSENYVKDHHMAQAQLITRATHGDSLADILERVLNTGLVIAGDIRIKLCDVELLSIQLRLLICSVEKARELGISWWWQTAPQPAAAPVAAVASLPLPTHLPQQGQEKGTGPICRDGPEGASHKLDLSPFPPEDYRQFREFQRFREVMQAIEHGPR
jgi:hypothetical protein